MARQARLAVAGHMHYVLLRSHNGMRVMTDPADRQLFLDALREACTEVRLHARALLDSQVHLLLRPDEGPALSRAMQALGRRFVAAYNRRHRRSGTLWDGRFRAAVVEPGEWSLAALRRVDRLDWLQGSEPPPQPLAGRWREATMLVDPPELWALGNTPFEREGAYAALLAQPLPERWERSIEAALRAGRVIGSEAFVRGLAKQTARRLEPRPRGRPRLITG